MKDVKIEIPVILCHSFNLDFKATEATRRILEVNGKKTRSDFTSTNLFKHFHDHVFWGFFLK